VDLRTVGLIVAGAGVVSAGVGAIFAVTAKSKYDDSLTKGCVQDTCTPPGAAVRNDARSAGDTATIFAVAAGVLIAGGGAMWLFAPAPEPKTAGALRLVPAVGMQGADVTLKGTW
jgi:hypothetical protein